MLKKIFKAEDVKPCGFMIQRLYSQMYPNGLTGEEIKELSKRHGFMKRVYDLVVIPYVNRK